MRFRILIAMTLLLSLWITREGRGILIPFSAKRIADAGTSCVHGYDGNFGQVGTYYAGDATAFNELIANDFQGDKPPNLGFVFKTKTIVLHPGPMTVPGYISRNRKIATDWLVTTYRDLEEETNDPGWHMTVDIWLGRQIKLNELKIPGGFAVKSGGEIEAFVARYQQTPGTTE